MESRNANKIADPEALAVWVLKRWWLFAYIEWFSKEDMKDLRQIGWQCAIENDYELDDTVKMIRREIRKFLKSKGYEYRRERPNSDKNRYWCQTIIHGDENVFDKIQLHGEEQNAIHPLRSA